MRLDISQVEKTKKAAMYVIDNKLATELFIEREIKVSNRWLYHFLDRKNKKRTSNPRFSHLAALNNYLYDNHPESFENSKDDSESTASPIY